MKKRTFIRVLSFFSAALLGMGCLYIKEKNTSEKYKLMIENSYSEAFEMLDSSLNNISITLEKIAYVSSPKHLSSYSAEIFSEAEIAKQALSKLPTGTGELSTLYRFLSQVGNYALSVSKNVISGDTLTDKQKEELLLLCDTAKIVTNVMNGAQISFNNAEYWASEIEEKISESVGGNSLADSLTELEENLTDYPTLIYDGPYSDHILNKEPLMTSNARQVSEDEALEILNNTIKGLQNVQFEDMQNGKIQCYRFTNDYMTVAISKLGGYFVYLSKNRSVGENVFSYEQALSKANRFLKDIGFENMIDTYYFTNDGVCVINFAYLDGQTICYTDLIKVGVALDNGEIVFMESSGYLTNHTDRAFETPVHTVDEAAAVISSDLEIEQSAIALIPSSGGGEVRCYEFLCRNSNGDEMLIYINTKTLDSEQIYILLKTDGGTLVK